MYYVIEIKGPDEPWWMFDGWTEYITAYQKEDTLEEALTDYRQRFRVLAKASEHFREKGQAAAFWNDGDVFFCDDCGDDTQAYTGLMIVDSEGTLIEK